MRAAFPYLRLISAADALRYVRSYQQQDESVWVSTY